ncbi:MAG: EamA family transporter [Desulfobacula sp.]|nr:EamA family transporter [Desulfobacula sp.]
MKPSRLNSSILNQGIIQIHIAVFLFGFAGLFGKFLSCSPLYIVFGRTVFAFIALFFYAKFVSKTILSISFNKRGLFFVLQGILLAIHWWSFFFSIQISSVAVGLVTFSTFPLFVTFLEPLFFKEQLKGQDIMLAGTMFIGIILVVPEFNISNNITKGAISGIFSGFTFALLALVNRKNTKTSHPIAIAFYQNLFASLFLVLPIMTIQTPLPGLSDLPNLIFLGVICTALAHTLFINSLAFIKARTASVITGLEPVYGIILAFIILNETPGARTLAGGLVIIGVSIVASVKTAR